MDRPVADPTAFMMVFMVSPSKLSLRATMMAQKIIIKVRKVFVFSVVFISCCLSLNYYWNYENSSGKITFS